MSKLIINEHPLLVLPSLASAIGLNEAIILQQVHYWLDPRINKNFKNGFFWVYNTYTQWAKQFPFWSEVTIRRTIRSLEDKKLIISQNFNKNSFLKVKWYTINYDTLSSLELSLKKQSSADTSDQNEHTIDQNDLSRESPRSNTSINMIGSYIETETTSKNTTNNSLNLNRVNLNNQNKQINFEREKEMINIWDKTIRENETSSTCSKARLLSLKKSLENYFNDDLKEWAEYCLKIKNNNFLMGGGTNGWKADLTWATKEENLIRVLDGAYQKKEISTQQGTESILSDIEEESSSDSIWNNTKAILKNRVGESSYKSWFNKLRIAGYDEDKAIITAPSNFVKQWVLDHYLRDIVESFKQIEPQINNVEILIKA